MNKTIYIFVSIIVLAFLASCDDPVDYRNGSESEKLVIEAVISPSLDTTFAIFSTSVVVNDEVQVFEYPVVADIMVREISSGDEYTFEYDDDSQYFFNNVADIRVGETYELIAGLDQSDYLDVFATTKIPVPTEIKSIEEIRVDRYENPDIQGQYKLSCEYEIVLETPTEFPAYFRMLAYRDDMGVDMAGNPLLKSEALIHFDNMDFTEGGNACHDLEHRDGFLINYSKLEGGKMIVSFETESYLVEGEDLVPQIYFSLQTVEEDYYHYFLSTSKQIRAALNGSSQPISAYTNITNGHGIFTSYSESIHSIEVN